MERSQPEPAPSSTKLWREVSLRRFGREPEAHYYRGAAFVAWVHPAGVCGVFATAPQTGADLDEAWSAWAQLARVRSSPIAHLTDARAFRAAAAPHLLYGKLLVEGLRRTQELRALYSQVAVVIPEDWTSVWWAGAMTKWTRTPIQTSSSMESAWQFLGMPGDVARAVGELTASFDGQPSLRTSVIELLHDAPELDLDGVAARLGTSVRSVQRALARSGATFAELRTGVRLELARTQLLSTSDKVESVGAAVGFRSRAHFLRWFQDHVGDTPTGFRRRRDRAAERG